MTDTYNATLVRFARGSIDWENDTFRVLLVSDSTAYTPDIDNEEFVADVVGTGGAADEFDGTGYSRQDLTGRSVVQDNSAERARFDSDDTTVFPDVDGDTAQGAVIYKQVGGDDSSPGNDPVLAYYDGGSFPKAAGGGDLTVEWPTDGPYNLDN